MGNMKVFWAVNPEELHQREKSCNLVSFGNSRLYISTKQVLVGKRLLIYCICGGRQRIYLRKVALTPPLSNYSLSLGIATTFLLQWIARIQHRTTCTKLLRFCLTSEIHWKLGTKLHCLRRRVNTIALIAPLYMSWSCTSKDVHLTTLQSNCYTNAKIGRVARRVQADKKNTENKSDFVNTQKRYKYKHKYKY